jgi:signal transduction histidine kinase
VLCADTTTDPFAVARDARHALLLARLAPRSALAVPLRARGQTLGVMTLAWSKTVRQYTAEDVALADEFARHAAVAVDNARLYREAQAGIRVREEFLSVAGHELKTPLTALKLNLQGLTLRARRQPATKLADIDDRVTKMGWQLLRLERLMNELLDVSRVTAGRLVLEPERIDLRDLVQDVITRAEDDLAEVGSTVTYVAPDPVVGMWDPARLDQVATNLVANAIKYGLGRAIEVSVVAVGDRVRLEVSDHGIGIPPEKQDRIFGRFERAVSDRHYSGFGLGLWIVRQIVEASGGTIRFDSAVDRGTTFTVELPLNLIPP